MIGNRTQRLLGRALVTGALVAALAILVLIYARTGGRGGGAQSLAVPASASRGSGGGAHATSGSGSGSSPPGKSAGSGGPPLAAGSGESEGGQTGGSSGSAQSGPTGTFTGPVVHVLYGPVQVAVAMQAGKIVDIKALQLPTEHPQSLFISERVEPLLRSEALQAQSAEISIISGATFTSEGFAQSLAQALSKAKS